MSKQDLLTHRLVMVIVVVMSMLLVACGSSKPSITGKWEQVSGSGAGTIYEFFDDGTVNMGGLASKYVWPDSSHLNLGIGVYEASLSGDELTLKDTSGQIAMILKRYKELQPSPGAIAGTWGLSYPDDSECLKSLGLDYSPSQIVFGSDGTFKIEEGFSIVIAASGVTMDGQFSFSGSQIHISASGTETFSSLLGGTESKPISGEVNCSVTLSYSRLLFKDNQGKSTLYIRK